VVEPEGGSYLDRVEVFWVDAAYPKGSQISEGAAKSIAPVPRKNIGYIIKEDETEMTITFGTYDFKCQEYDRTISIPKKSIEKYVELDSGVEHLL
jgi:hypothetical protein